MNFLKTLLFVFSNIAALHAEKCLGIEGACRLRLDEVTLAGAHNAGAGFDGLLKYHVAFNLPALSCAYRNQDKSIYWMLNHGIRYFDIDLCYEDETKYGSGVWTCHSKAFGGKMSDFLDQVNRWINEPRNRREIVVLHFNRDYRKGQEDSIGKGIYKLLRDRWNPDVNNGNVKFQSNINSLVGDSIKENKRIYKFLHSNLKKHNAKYLFDQDYIGYTWTSMGYVGSNGCKNLADQISDKCPRQSLRKFVRLDLYLSWGLCVHDFAKQCNQYVGYAAKRCYNNIKSGTRSKTINFIVIDFINQRNSLDAVNVAKQLTLDHIKQK